jgi:site-specific recombinase XerD
MQINERDFVSFITIKRGLAEHSIRHCRIRLRVIQKWFFDKELSKITVEQFFNELKSKGLKNNSLNSYFFVFYQIREYCKDRGLPSNFLDGFKSFKKTKPDIIIFTPEEIEKILNTNLTYGKFYGKDTSFLDDRYLTLTMFLAYTGCRCSEAINLTIKHLDVSAGKATFINTKTNENRTVYFTEPLKNKLKNLIVGKKLDDLVFRNSLENKINVSDYSFDLKKRAKFAGIIKRVFPHNFRHSYITHLLEVGVPITEVASLVGHKDIQTTYSTYMHLADKTLQKAAMRHPLVRRNVYPQEIINSVDETLKSFHFEMDKRFKYKIHVTDVGIEFSIFLIKKLNC